MKSAASPLFISFIYDFSMTGGAIGVIDTGIQLPNRAAVRVLSTYISTAIAGAADVTLGTVTTPTLLSGVAVTLANPQPVAHMVGFVGSATTPFAIMDTTLNIRLTIATAAITAGRFSVSIQYFLFQ